MDDQSNTTKNIDSIVIDNEDEHEDNIDQGREYDLHTEDILHADTYRDERKHVITKFSNKRSQLCAVYRNYTYRWET